MNSLPFSQVAKRLAVAEDDVWAIHYEAADRLKAGEDIILMSVGDPDFPTPDDISTQLVSSIKRGRTHYSPPNGELELRSAIAELECQATGKVFSADHFVIFPGATGALYATLSTLCDPGDEIVIPEPMYIGYRGYIKALGIEVKSPHLNLDEDCALDVDELLAYVGPKTKAVLVNTPGNPLGNIIPAEQLASLAEALAERNVWLISDEVYSLLTFEEPHVSLLKCAKDLSNVIVIDGLSKSHAMTGWRIGWVAGPLELTQALTNYSSAALFGCSQFIQDAAAYALKTNGPYVDHMCELYRQRRDFFAERVKRIPNLDCLMPKAGMFMMLDFRRISNDVPGLVRQLLDVEGVSFVPGEGFGPTAASFARASLTHDLDTLNEVGDRLERFLAAY